MEMKKILLALLCANLVGTVWAEDPPAAQAPAQAGTLPALPADAAVPGQGGSCPVSTRKVCVPEPTTKKTTKAVYSCRCEDFCLPGFHLHGLFHHTDGDACPACEAGKCGHPLTKKVLVKKVCTEECDSYKCVPAEVPVEPQGHHGWFWSRPAPAPTVEKSAPPGPEK
jgi:hypothetical protein